MKLLKLFGMVSLAANIILLILLFQHHSAGNQESDVNVAKQMPQDMDITSRYNFEKIFLEKNDSVYQAVFNRSFDKLPVYTYLMACTYYLIKKDSVTRHDLEMISTEIKGIYGQVPKIPDDGNVSK
jgi:hypothetical protein